MCITPVFLIFLLVGGANLPLGIVPDSLPLIDLSLRAKLWGAGVSQLPSNYLYSSLKTKLLYSRVLESPLDRSPCWVDGPKGPLLSILFFEDMSLTVMHFSLQDAGQCSVQLTRI